MSDYESQPDRAARDGETAEAPDLTQGEHDFATPGSVLERRPDAGWQQETGNGSWRELLGDTGQFTSEWDRIRAGFVDEPRRAVEEADQLVGKVIDHLSTSLSSERALLEEQWHRSEQVNTEDLRVALRRYHSFYNEMLSR